MKKLQFSVRGMKCRSCELLLERKLLAVKGVEKADADFGRHSVVVTLKHNATVLKSTLENVIRDAGYSLQKDKESQKESEGHVWMEIGGSLVVLLAIIQLLRVFDLTSFAPSTSGALTISSILLIGLIAGSSSCLATTGGLLLAVASTSSRIKTRSHWQSSLYFNTGRLVSYYFFGGVIGLLGRGLSFSTVTTGYLTIAIACLMIPIGLSLAGITPAFSFIRLPKSITRRIAAIAGSEHPAAPALLGAGTFFLPCGFTQSLQLVALASGSFAGGATVMAVFALGTLPSLIGITLLTSFTKGSASRILMRFAGTVIIVLGILNMRSGFALTGIQVTGVTPEYLQAPKGEGVQEIAMTVTPSSYSPNTLTIQAGRPVRWLVDGTNALGCTSIMTIPALGITKPLAAGENIIEFTAPTKGPLAFMCSMGMVRGTFNVI